MNIKSILDTGFVFGGNGDDAKEQPLWYRRGGVRDGCGRLPAAGPPAIFIAGSVRFVMSSDDRILNVGGRLTACDRRLTLVT